MRRYRLFAVTSLLVALMLLLGVTSPLAASDICESSLPWNIDAGLLEPIALALLHRSPTFQQQCHRIAAATVRVRVRITTVLLGSRGETTIRRYEAGALRADVVLAFGEDYVELLAHEFEHVLEQVDQVRLAHEVSAGRAWTTETGAFETVRAWEAGMRVRQETDTLAAEAVETRWRLPPRPRDPFE